MNRDEPFKGGLGPSSMHGLPEDGQDFSPFYSLTFQLRTGKKFLVLDEGQIDRLHIFHI